MPSKKTENYLQREISWMYFNHRLIQEASDDTVPLLERLNFLGIYSNNLDEFFRVRVAMLNRIVRIKDSSLKSEKKKVEKLLDTLHQLNKKYTNEFEEVFSSLKNQLETAGIFILNENEISEAQKDEVLQIFRNVLNRHIYPRMIQPKANFEDISDENVYLAIRLTDKHSKKEFALLELPTNVFGRFIELKQTGKNKKIIMFLDDAIRVCLSNIFVGRKYLKYEAYAFKITKDSEIDIEPGFNGDILDKVAKAVKNRKKGLPVRFIFDSNIPGDLLSKMCKVLKIGKSDLLIPGSRYHNLKDLMRFPDCGSRKLKYPQIEPIHLDSIGGALSPLHLIHKKDVLLHYPYHHFSNYIHILREAAISNDVQEIKITLYRLARNSSVAEALICAAKNGKKVTAIVELFARFDEASNIYWSQKMQEAGIKVILGKEGLKVHSKLTYIKHREGDIACISTGNFHEGNAAVYTDFTLMTSVPKLVKEVAQVFHFIEKPYLFPKFSELLVAPVNLRTKMTALINNEIKNARKGKQAYIRAKLNHLTDSEIVDQLYEAALAGVKIELLVRGSCSIKTTSAEISSSIRIKGIIDRYLEHSRIFIFCNGGNEKYYMGSSDWITRNFETRVEVLVPVYAKEIRDELKLVIDYGLKDNTKARIVDGSGDNTIEGGEPLFRSQEQLYNYYKSKQI